MENKEMKKPIPVELGDDMLDGVGGGIDAPELPWVEIDIDVITEDSPDLPVGAITEE